jgi:hypothetical protein
LTGSEGAHQNAFAEQCQQQSASSQPSGHAFAMKGKSAAYPSTSIMGK